LHAERLVNSTERDAEIPKNGTQAKTMDSFQISPQQERVWAAEAGEADGPAARVQAVLAIEGELAAGAIEQALRDAVARHESLRTTFARQPGLTFPAQAVNATLEPHVETLDLSTLEASAQAARLEEILRRELRAPLRLEHGPLVRAALVRKGRESFALVLTLSALCAEETSTALLLEEIARRLGDGEVVEDPLQYADFSAWQHELADSEEEEARTARAFWQQLGEVRSPELPFARTGDGSASLPGDGRSPSGSEGARLEEVSIEIDEDLARALETQASRYGAPVAALAQTAWQAVLGRSCAAEKVAVAFLSGKRRHPDLEGAVGAFARPVPVEVDVQAKRSFAEALADVTRERAQALVRQDYAPASPQEGLEVGFVEYPAGLSQPSGLRLRIARMARLSGEMKLAAMCGRDGERVALSIVFDPARHGRQAVERLAGALGQMLHAAGADAGVALGEVQPMGDSELERVLRTFNETAKAVGEECVHQLIARQALSAPARTAVVDAHGSIDYAQLDARANRLANRLRALGVGSGEAVGLCTDRSIEMVVGLLGILKAGGAYLPLHHEHPPARLAHQLSAAQAKTLVTQEALRQRVAGFEGELLCLDRDRAEIEAQPSEAPSSAVSHGQEAYIIYTSGSTGTPKGVAVTHGNLANYAAYIIERLGADQAPSSFALVTSISTDLGNTSVFGALCSGGTLVLVAPAQAGDPGAVAGLMDRAEVDVLKITPSHLAALLAAGDARVLPRRWLVVGGERADWDLVERVRSLSDCKILNHYGPTETTIGSCTYLVGAGPGEYRPASVPIGRPIANTRCYVLDDRLRPVPLGVPGRLFVAGAGVARGYVGEPQLTAERFVADPFLRDAQDAPSARMYDTGDVVRWLPDGALEFLGRGDEQVKLRGYRVEPAEVEGALRAHPAVRETLAIVQASDAGEPRLIAYCTVEGTVDSATLQAHLAEWLPEHMLPSAIVTLAEMPRTPSGKIDRQALPHPNLDAAQAAAYVAPRTPLEEEVARIWEQVLGLERVGVEDDFFALGGHSLLATQVVAQVRSDFAVDLPLHSLFTCPTVATLANEIVQMMGDSEGDETARLMAELEGMSDEEAQRLLAEDLPPQARPG
jgi:amino acid adenylation domain-containing protein